MRDAEVFCCLCMRVKEKSREREGDPGRIRRVFCELMETAAYKRPSLRRNLHLGRHLSAVVCACVRVCACESERE